MNKGLEPASSIDPVAIREQLERLLASPIFSHSKTCASFLRYVVEEDLKGNAKYIKERQIGIAVFSRKPTYDSEEDPVVRRSAVEVRKRIAQYYHMPEHENELRIDLKPGSYVPEFSFPHNRTVPEETNPREILPYLPQPGMPPDVQTIVNVDNVKNAAVIYADASKRTPKIRPAVLLAPVIVLAAAAIVFTVIGRQRSQPAFDAFWNPLLRGNTITITLGYGVDHTPTNPLTLPAKEMTLLERFSSDLIGFPDALTAAYLAGFVSSKGCGFDIRRSASLKLEELSRQSVILVGLISNRWAARYMDQLRFYWEIDRELGSMLLRDRQSGNQIIWSAMSWDEPASKFVEDRAIIARLIDKQSGHAVLILGGFGSNGVIAAREFVTESQYLTELATRAPSDWGRKNIEILLATDVADGTNGPPRIVATHFW